MKEEFYIGNFKVMRDDRKCSMVFIPRENIKEEEEKEKKVIQAFVNSENFKIIDKYISTPYIETIKELDSNWEDLKKWLVEKSDACRLKGTATESLRWGTYDEVLNKMIGLEGSDKNGFSIS